jgi:hypothetical protein
MTQDSYKNEVYMRKKEQLKDLLFESDGDRAMTFIIDV